MARAHTAPLLLPALVLLLLGAGAVSGNADFCRTISTALNTCPLVPTADVDLASYTGRWYEIGVNAQFHFAFFGQQGGQCVYANYTALGVINGTNTIKVVNRALVFQDTIKQVQTLGISSSAALAGLGVRFLCTFLVGQQPLSVLLPQLSGLNDLIPSLGGLLPGGPGAGAAPGPGAGPGAGAGGAPGGVPGGVIPGLPGGLSDLAPAAGGLLSALPPAAQGALGSILKSLPTGDVKIPGIPGIPGDIPIGPLVADAVKGATSKLIPQVNVADVTKAVGGFTKTIEYVQKMAASTLGNPSSVDYLANIIYGALNTTTGAPIPAATSAQIYAQLSIIEGALENVSISAAAVFGSLEAIQVANGEITGTTLPAPPVVPKLTASIQIQTFAIGKLVKEVQSARETILGAATAIQAAATGVSPVIAGAAAGIAGLAAENGPLSLSAEDINIARQLIFFTSTVVRAGPPTSRVQDIEGRAKQNATEPGALRVFFGPGGGGPYNIIKLEGAAAAGYDLALVFSCDASIGSAFLPQNGFFILSRTPTVPQAVIDESLAFLAKQGVFLGGDNAFLTVSQNDKLCKPITVLP